MHTMGLKQSKMKECNKGQNLETFSEFPLTDSEL